MKRHYQVVHMSQIITCSPEEAPYIKRLFRDNFRVEVAVDFDTKMHKVRVTLPIVAALDIDESTSGYDTRNDMGR